MSLAAATPSSSPSNPRECVRPTRPAPRERRRCRRDSCWRQCTLRRCCASRGEGRVDGDVEIGGNRGRNPAAQPVGHGAVVASMHDERRRSDVGKVRAYVEAVDESQQCGGGLGGRGLPLQPGEVLMLGTAEEEVAEKTGAESPMRLHRSEDGVLDRSRRDFLAIGIRPVEHQALDAFRKTLQHRRLRCNSRTSRR